MFRWACDTTAGRLEIVNQAPAKSTASPISTAGACDGPSGAGHRGVSLPPLACWWFWHSAIGDRFIAIADCRAGWERSPTTGCAPSRRTEEDFECGGAPGGWKAAFGKLKTAAVRTIQPPARCSAGSQRGRFHIYVGV
jgi:hypothetical protein